MRYLLVLLCACRFSWSAWQGAPPRSANDVKMTLYAADAQSMTMARSVLQHDPHLTLIDFDPTVIEKQKTDCGNASCPLAVEAACSWSALQGAEYYALAAVGASFTSSYECTQYKGDLLAKHDECVAGHVTNEQTTATYTLDVYDVKSCKLVPTLSQKVTARAQGPEDLSKSEALENLGTQVLAKSEGLPDQITIAANGRIAGDARDGYYALFRDGQYRGYVRARDAGTPSEALTPMYCCLSPQPGDALVARGRRRFVDLALGATVGMTSGGYERRLATGVGAHLRYYALDGGLQLGFGGDILLRDGSSWGLLNPELGWGFAVAPGVVVSANLGAGWTSVTIDGGGENGTRASATALHVIPTARIVTFLTTWWYASADIGIAITGTFEAAGPPPWSERMPIARLNLGFDL